MKPNKTKINREVGENIPQKNYAGVDISKDYLDICLQHKTYRFTNNKTGHKNMFRLFEKQEQPVHVVYESTGYLSRRLIPVFMDANISQTCLNPVRVRNYARSEGLQAKTDRLDAQVLCQLGKDKQLEQDYPLTREILQLKEYESVLTFYVKRRAQLKNEQKATNQPFLKQQLDQALKQKEKRIEALQVQMEKLINTHQELKEKYETYLNVKGIGKRNAMALISLMPELGSINRKQASALLGVVPYSWESGTMKGTRKIHGGRKELRHLLYLATVSALRCNEILQAKYKHFLSVGKTRKCALIACCHSLIIYLNSLTKKIIPPDAASHAAGGIGGE